MANTLPTVDHTERYRASIARLMPTGFAWNVRKGSVQYAWTQAYAAQLNAFENYAYRLMEQSYPHATCTRLNEWLQVTGLPDGCFPNATSAELRLQMLARLRGVNGFAYDDTSPASPAYIEHLCAQIGYSVTVWYNWPFRVGRNRVGQRLGALDGQLNVQVNRVCQPFRVGRNRVGQPLDICTQTGLDLLCYLRRIVPARFAIRTLF